MIGRRRTPVPPVVERKHRRNPGALQKSPSPKVAPDRHIRTWRADDNAARKIEAFNHQSDLAQKQQAIASACKMLQARLYRPNYQSIYEELARREVDWWAVGDTLSHIVEVRRPSDGSPQHWRLYPKKHTDQHARLGQSLLSLWPNTKKIIGDPRAPKRPRRWDCIKEMRKRSDER